MYVAGVTLNSLAAAATPRYSESLAVANSQGFASSCVSASSSVLGIVFSAGSSTASTKLEVRRSA